MGKKKEKLIALCKSPGYCVQAHVPPPREEVQGRKEGQRRAVAVIGSRKGEQNFLISNQREGDSQGLCRTSMNCVGLFSPSCPMRTEELNHSRGNVPSHRAWTVGLIFTGNG